MRSPRRQKLIDALPLNPGMHILEIGCGPGAMARAMARRIGPGFVLGIDRSETAIAQASANAFVESGTLRFLHAAIEDFILPPGMEPFDLAVAIRVGALDGRHPDIAESALKRIAAALKPDGRLFTDKGELPGEIPLKAYRSRL